MSSAKSAQNILVLDVGTTGVKGLVFDRELEICAESYQPLERNTPESDWVEQNPQQYLTSSQKVLRDVLIKCELGPEDLIGLGITNQRETTILWDKKTGQPVYPAIVWEDKRTADYCENLVEKYQQKIADKTGLAIDSYFSASKIRWILDNVPEIEQLGDRNQLAFGTVDSWIMWNWLDDSPHFIDATNASRTLLYNVRELNWDDELTEIFSIPKNILPEVKSSLGEFGKLRPSILNFDLSVLAVCGDQQASTYAAGTVDGTTKITYGTGTFLAQQIGHEFALHEPFFTMLLAGRDGSKPLYAVEGKVESSARAVNAVLDDPAKLKKVITKIAYEVDKYIQQLPLKPEKIVVDGGITKYEHLTDIQSEISGVLVERQRTAQSTALGVAKMMRDYYEK